MLYAIVAVIALILDQAVKYWTTANIVLNVGSKELVPGLVHLTNIHNTGAAFSFMEGARWFFVILCVVFVAALIVLLAKNVINTPLARWMSVIVMAGAVGNCIDRIICGYVVDMFEFDFLIFGGSFPVFNIADIFITVGGILFCLCILFEKEPAASDKSAPAEEGGAPKAEKRSFKLPTRREKTAIPDFPRHEMRPNPEIDPNDPFAEWERRAAGKKTVTAKPEPDISQKIGRTVERSPIREQTAAPTAQGEPRRAAEAAPQASGRSSDSYDLEDILAEFKDL